MTHHPHNWVQVQETLGGTHWHSLCRDCGVVACNRRACRETTMTESELAARWQPKEHT